MSNDHTSPSEIITLVEGVNKAAANFETSVASQGDLHLARRRLQHEAQKLLSSLEEPNGEVWTRTFQVSGQHSSKSTRATWIVRANPLS